MRRRLLILLPVAAAAAATMFWALAQPAPQTMSSLFPAGALLYLEAKDFGALLADWNGSGEKRDWLASSNYEGFSRLELFLKLGDAQTQFATAAGVPPDYALLTSVAGANSGVAMYDIGKLEFLYVAHMPSARAMNTSLWKLRGTYQTRHAGTADYFVKEDRASHRVAAFAYTGDTLLLATKEELIAGSLRLIAREALPSVASEQWFTDSVHAAALGPSDLRLVYNMSRLARTYQFRSHWIQSNVPELRQFASGLADLDACAARFASAGFFSVRRPVTLQRTPKAPQASCSPRFPTMPDCIAHGSIPRRDKPRSGSKKSYFPQPRLPRRYRSMRPRSSKPRTREAKWISNRASTNGPSRKPPIR